MLEHVIAVSLDPYQEIPSESEAERAEQEARILKKWVSEDYLGKTYAQLIKYMRNPDPDRINSEGYNAERRKTVSIINDWIKEAKEDEERNPQNRTVRFDVGYIPNDGSKKPIIATTLEGGLDREVRMDQDRSIHIDQETEYRSILLVAEKNMAGSE